MNVGDKVKCVYGRTSPSYIGIEGIITDVVETNTPHKTRHVRIKVTKTTKMFSQEHTFIYCSDLQLVPHKLNKDTRVL